MGAERKEPEAKGKQKERKEAPLGYIVGNSFRKVFRVLAYGILCVGLLALFFIGIGGPVAGILGWMVFISLSESSTRL